MGRGHRAADAHGREDAAPEPNAPVADAEGATDESGSQPAGKRRRRSSKSRERNAETGRRRRFRETLWFKRGETDEGVTEGHLAADALTEPLDEERYREDAVSSGDEERYSIRTGTTQYMEALSEDYQDAEVSEAELIAELKSSRTQLVAGLIAGAAIVIIVAVAAVLL
jgi:hypothetical protein